MVILRPTRKLHRWLPPGPDPGASHTALGDWYVNRLIVDRQPLLLLLSARSLLPLLLPARDVRGLPLLLADHVAARLRRLDIDTGLIDAEVGAMAVVAVARTVDRSVLGTMVDFASAVPSYLDPGGWDDSTLPLVEADLARTPCRASRRDPEVIWPDRATTQLLAERWGRLAP